MLCDMAVRLTVLAPCAPLETIDDPSKLLFAPGLCAAAAASPAAAAADAAAEVGAPTSCCWWLCC